MKPTLTIRFAALPLVGLLSTGCLMGPKYERPKEAVPGAFTGQDAAANGAQTFGDLPWFEVFQDDALLDLINTALKQNTDLKLAANRVLQSEVQLGIVKADQAPSVNLQAQGDRGVSGTSRSMLGPNAKPADNYVANLGVSWELDLWGKLRRQTEAARATFMASQENQRLVLQSLVAGVAQGYYQLRELDCELEVAKSTLASRQESLKLVKLRQEQGVASMSDVAQADSLVQSALHSIPLIEQQLVQQEASLNVLLGRYEGKIRRGKPLDDQRLVVNVPSGIPSQLLERRPDVRLAEQQLVAANAQVGVAKASLFPSIGLTASGGYISNDLSRLVTSGNKIWDVGANLTAPIFEGGKLRANVKLSELQKEQMVLQYSKAVQQAFSEASTTLISIDKCREARKTQEAYTKACETQLTLANQRYQGGVTTYLEVQDAERTCFDARRALAQAKRDELLSVLNFYKALGGGWQTGTQAAPLKQS